MHFMKLLTAAITAGLAGLMAHTSTAATWYVKPTGDDANDGTTWATAKQTIQAGVDAGNRRLCTIPACVGVFFYRSQ